MVDRVRVATRRQNAAGAVWRVTYPRADGPYWLIPFTPRGFEPQTPGPPLVNVPQRTTQANLGVAIGVLLFLVGGISVVFWAARRESRGEPVRQPPEPRK